MLSWFDAREAKQFGESLAKLFVNRVPPDLMLKDKTVAKSVDKVMAEMTVQIERFRQSHQLNVYKRAQLGNAFKWTLQEAGFSSAYVDELTKWTMLQIC